MGKNFVLKGAGGQPGGYLMQGPGKLRCKVYMEQPAELVVIDEEGRERAHALSGGEEREWPDAGHPLAAAYVAANGNLLLDTGEEGRRAFERRRERERNERQRALNNTRQDRGRAEEGQTGEKEAGPARERKRENLSAQRKADALTETAWPERRWPPPPCWPAARYRAGRWDEEEAAAPGQERSGQEKEIM